MENFKMDDWEWKAHKAYYKQRVKFKESEMVLVKYKVLQEGLTEPSYATSGSSGLDLYSSEDKTISPLTKELVSTGIAIQLPKGFEAQIRPRSGLATKHGITILNSPGTIDADYRGEVKVLLINHSISDYYNVKKGDRIAQMVIMPVPTVTLLRVTELTETTRGDGGFGSTGA